MTAHKVRCSCLVCRPGTDYQAAKRQARRPQSARLAGQERILAASQAVVRRRDRGRCWVCQQPAEQIHHRRPRGRGGSSDAAVNQPGNLLSLCARCHCEIESQRAAAVELGYLVQSRRVPSMTPIWRSGVRPGDGWWVLLDDDGCVIRVSA